jgi:hypothetical protein
MAFVADTNLSGNLDCIREITVEAEDGPSATPGPGDEVGVLFNVASTGSKRLSRRRATTHFL